MGGDPAPGLLAWASCGDSGLPGPAETLMPPDYMGAVISCLWGTRGHIIGTAGLPPRSAGMVWQEQMVCQFSVFCLKWVLLELERSLAVVAQCWGDCRLSLSAGTSVQAGGCWASCPSSFCPLLSGAASCVRNAVTVCVSVS
jgi:hypothetical protein